MIFGLGMIGAVILIRFTSDSKKLGYFLAETNLVKSPLKNVMIAGSGRINSRIRAPENPKDSNLLMLYQLVNNQVGALESAANGYNKKQRRQTSVPFTIFQ